MTHPLIKRIKIGFIGTGHMSQALIKGLIDSKILNSDQIYAANRTPGKLLKLKELFQIEILDHNEGIIENCDIIVLGMKPQDFTTAVQDLGSSFREEQIIISLAAGIEMNQLEKLIPCGRIIRLMPNTPSTIHRGVIGLYSRQIDHSAADLVTELFKNLGYVLKVESENQFESLMIACSCGTGFVFELMLYWQDWIQEHGFSPDESKKMTIETFLGASLLAAQSTQIDIENLQQKVTSKKGVTEKGLSSMRELDIERALRISFEKAALRAKEFAQQNTFK